MRPCRLFTLYKAEIHWKQIQMFHSFADKFINNDNIGIQFQNRIVNRYTILCQHNHHQNDFCNKHSKFLKCSSIEFHQQHKKVSFFFHS